MNIRSSRGLSFMDGNYGTGPHTKPKLFGPQNVIGTVLKGSLQYKYGSKKQEGWLVQAGFLVSEWKMRSTLTSKYSDSRISCFHVNLSLSLAFS